MKQSTWLSAYLYFDGRMYEEPADTIIRRIVGPVVAGWRTRGDIDEFFFIRYSEGRPHIRLRVRTKDAQRATGLAGELSEALAAERGADVDGDGVAISAEARRLVGDLTFTKYEPETDRYGGAAVLEIAEEIFGCSSRAALAILDRLEGSTQTRRLGQALLAMLVLLHAFAPSGEDAMRLMRTYADQYVTLLAGRASSAGAVRTMFDAALANQASRLEAVVADTWQRLEDGDPLTAALDGYRSELAAPAAAFLQAAGQGGVVVNGRATDSTEEAVRAVVPSHVHMTNNRLGVSVPQEMYLAHVIAESFQRQDRAALAADA